MMTERVKFTNPMHYSRTQPQEVCEYWLRLHWAEHEDDPDCEICVMDVSAFFSAVMWSLAQHLGISLQRRRVESQSLK
jgi:hypothetical protein